MSDTQFSADRPVYPPKGGTEAEATEQQQNGDSPEPSPEPMKFKIGEREYAEEELQELIGGGLRQADYTRKTQKLAEERRQLEEQKRALEEERARIVSEARQTQSEPAAEGDPWNELNEISPALSRTLRGLDAKVNRLNEALEADAKQVEFESSLNRAMKALEDRPFFDHAAIVAYMAEHGLSPNQAEVAYMAVCGPKVGRMLGEESAIKRGANVPPVMGSSGPGISPGFTAPNEIPGGRDYSKMSWQEVAKVAQEDPDIPKG